jgi:hypothetical protein
MKHLKKFENIIKNNLEDIDFENINDILIDIIDDFEFEEYRIYWYDEDICRDLGIECKNKYDGGINILIVRKSESDDKLYFENRFQEIISRLSSEYKVYISKIKIGEFTNFLIFIHSKN